MEEGPQRMHGLVYPETEIINLSHSLQWLKLDPPDGLP
jgi:hypothetical protein